MKMYFQLPNKKSLKYALVQSVMNATINNHIFGLANFALFAKYSKN